MKMLHGAPYSFQYPIHVAIKNSDKALALFIIKNMEVYLGKNSSGSNSLQLAAKKGMVDIVAALKSLYDDTNSPNSDGKTPIQLAEINGHSEVIEILSPGTCKPSTSRENSVDDTKIRRPSRPLGPARRRRFGDFDEEDIISRENHRINNYNSIANINIESGIGENETEPERMDED